EEGGESLRGRLDMVKQLLAKEQSRVRGFVQGMSATTSENGSMVLARDLQKPLKETALHWGCAATLSVEPEDATVPRAMGGELSLRRAEAVANAVRHGRASKIDVALAKGNGQIVVTVRDNGTGFSTNGARVLPASTPASLCGRLHELGGTIEVSS